MEKKSVRERVLDAAIEVVQTQSISQLTLDAVAREAGVSKGGLLHHFNSKEALLMGMMARATERFDEELRANSGPGESGEATLLEAFFSGTYVKRAFSGLGSKDHSALSLLAAAAHERALLNPVNAYFETREKEILANARDPGKAMAAILAADGLWLFDALGIKPFSAELRRQVERAILDWVEGKS